MRPQGILEGSGNSDEKKEDSFDNNNFNHCSGYSDSRNGGENCELDYITHHG